MISRGRRLSRLEAVTPSTTCDPFAMEVAEIEALIAVEVEPVLVEGYGCAPGAGARFVASRFAQEMKAAGPPPTDSAIASMLRRFAADDYFSNR